MTKITARDRLTYQDRINPYKESIEGLLKREKMIVRELKKNNADSAFQRLTLINEMLNLTANYIILSEVSLSMLKQRNENALNDARKAYIRTVVYMEDLVSPLVDVPFSDYEEKLAEIAELDAKSRYLLARKMGLILGLLQNACGVNSRWKWAFVELEARLAALTKNILDLKAATANTDPRSPNYEPTILHLRLIRRLLARTATRYRDRYELSTKNPDDLGQSVRFLGSLRRLHAVLGEPREAEAAKKKVDSLSLKLEAIIKKKKEETGQKT